MPKKRNTLTTAYDINGLYKSLISPFVIEKDVDYYSSIRDKLIEFQDYLCAIDADSKLIKVAETFREKILTILREYYKGNIASAQLKLANQIKRICDEDKNAANSVKNCYIFRDSVDDNIPLFRARLDADEDGFKAKDMGAIPFTLRTRADTSRFSMPGLPCLYLGNTSYACWIEMGKPADYRFNVSLVLLDGTIKVFDMAISLGYLVNIDPITKQMKLADSVNEGTIKRLMLTFCSSYRVKEAKRLFKSEYIIPQLIMLACQKQGLGGVAYISAKAMNSGKYGICAINIALFSKYKNNVFKDHEEHSDLEKYIKVSDSINFSLYLHIQEDPIIRNEMLWIDRCKWLNKSIPIQDEPFEYRNTQFHHFDEYIYYKWLDKEAKKSKGLYYGIL